MSAASATAGVLVRVLLDLLLSSRPCASRAGRSGRRGDRLEAVPARADLPVRRAGTPRRSTCTRPRAGTWCGRWSGWPQQHGVPFQMPAVFPQNSLQAARLALVGAEAGWIVAFTKAVYLAEFRDGSDISSKAVLEDILRGLQLDPAPLLRASPRRRSRSSSRTRRTWRRKAASSARPRSWSARSCSGATIAWSRRWSWRDAGDLGSTDHCLNGSARSSITSWARAYAAGGNTVTRLSTGLIAVATAAVFATFASMADAQEKKSAAKPKSKCNAITEETACKADATCIWVPATTNAKTGKQRKAYCKSKPMPKKKSSDKK